MFVFYVCCLCSLFPVLCVFTSFIIVVCCSLSRVLLLDTYVATFCWLLVFTRVLLVVARVLLVFTRVLLVVARVLLVVARVLLHADDQATIRVSNLPENMREVDLQELFSPFGKILRTFLAKDKVTGQSKVGGGWSWGEDGLKVFLGVRRRLKKLGKLVEVGGGLGRYEIEGRVGSFEGGHDGIIPIYSHY